MTGHAQRLGASKSASSYNEAYRALQAIGKERLRQSEENTQPGTPSMQSLEVIFEMVTTAAKHSADPVGSIKEAISGFSPDDARNRALATEFKSFVKGLHPLAKTREPTR